jgi:ADP-heptose:LPS heptosyltransferase
MTKIGIEIVGNHTSVIWMQNKVFSAMLNRWKNILYDLTARAARLGSTSQPSGRALVVRVDEIGDYMLWRPVLRHLLNASVLKGMKITLCGNASWRSLYEQLDLDCFQEVIWVDKLRFKKDLYYRYRLLRELNRAGFEVVINPTYSRDKRNDDALVYAAAGKTVYGMVANRENWRSYDDGYDAELYHHLFRGPDTVMFEWYRNRLFAEFVSGTIMTDMDWKVKDEQLLPLSVHLPPNYLVIFPGSRNPKRIWPAAYFAEVATYCQNRWGWEVVLCGGPSDAPYATAFLESFSGVTTNLIGVTRLPELLTILRGAQWLVTVDTGSVHLAAAVGCPTSAVFNGSQYGRFAPYPADIPHRIHAIYPKEIQAALAQPDMVRSHYTYTVDVPYALVQPAQVLETINP